MKYQCSVCGQIIDRNDSCPICGSDGSKIISLGDENNSTTYRCLSCGRVFENRDVCPYCNGEELYDLTHDKMFNRNDIKKEENHFEEEQHSEQLDLFSSLSNDDHFDDKPVDLSKHLFEELKEEVVEEKEEDNSSLILDDEYENSDIIIHQDQSDIKKEDDLFDKTLPDNSLNEEEVEEESEIDKDTIFASETNEITAPWEEDEENIEEEANDETLEATETEIHLINEKEELVSNQEEQNNAEEIKGDTLIDEINENNKTNEEVSNDSSNDLTSLKEKRINNLLKLISLLTKDYFLKSDDIKLENKELILSKLFKEFAEISKDNNFDFNRLMEEKEVLDNEIFIKEPTPFNGYLSYENNEIKELNKKND